jgi:hypothetical protein
MEGLLQYPEQLKKVIGTNHGCQSCEHRFRLEELNANGKKSKTWTMGIVTWGQKDPQLCEAFIIKCPGCGNPSQVIITSLRQSAGPPPKADPAQATETPPKKNGNAQELPPAKALTQHPRRIERKP